MNIHLVMITAIISVTFLLALFMILYSDIDDCIEITIFGSEMKIYCEPKPPGHIDDLPLPVSKELYDHQHEIISQHIISTINNIDTFSKHITNIIDESYDPKLYNQTKSFVHVEDSLNETKLFDVNTPVPNGVKYFFMIDHDCKYILYAYDNSKLNRPDARGLDHCDNLVGEPTEEKILTKNYPATALWTFVNTYAQSYDLNNDGKIDFVLGTSINWDKISEEIQNLIFIDNDTQYLLVDGDNTVLMKVTKNEIFRLEDYAEDIIREEDLRINGELMMNRESEGPKYQEQDSHESKNLNIEIDGKPLKNWKVVMIRSDK